MGKPTRCAYCGDTQSSLTLAFPDVPDLYICADCSERRQKNLFGEKMNEFEVTFHLISGRQITMSEMTPDKTVGDYTMYLISNPYNVFYTDDGHTVVVNMANVTSFNVHKKEKEE